MVDNHINQELLYSFFSGYLEHGTIEEGEIKDAYYSIFLEDFEYVEDSILFKKNIKMLLKTLNRECKKAKINIKGIRETIK